MIFKFCVYFLYKFFLNKVYLFFFKKKKFEAGCMIININMVIMVSDGK